MEPWLGWVHPGASCAIYLLGPRGLLSAPQIGISSGSDGPIASWPTVSRDRPLYQTPNRPHYRLAGKPERPHGLLSVGCPAGDGRQACWGWLIGGPQGQCPTQGPASQGAGCAATPRQVLGLWWLPGPSRMVPLTPARARLLPKVVPPAPSYVRTATPRGPGLSGPAGITHPVLPGSGGRWLDPEPSVSYVRPRACTHLVCP